MTAEITETRRIEALQALRALAAALVLAGHAAGEAAAHIAPLGSWAAFFWRFPWNWGVDLFFVLSGTVIAISGARHAGAPGGWRRFLWARFLRVVPLYWLFSLLMLAVLLAAPGQVHSIALEWRQVWASFAFLPYRAETGLAVPILSVGWTLNYEIFFYAVFGLLLAFGRGIAVTVMLLCLVLGFAAFAGIWVPEEMTALWTWTRTLVLEFALGAVIGAVWLGRGGRGWACPAWVALVLCCGIAAAWPAWREAMQGLGLSRGLVAGPAAAALVAVAVLLVSRDAEARLPRWLVALGDSSYALYLSHLFTLRAVALAWVAVLPGQSALYVPLAFLLALAVGHGVFLWVERPLLARLRRRRHGG